MVAFIFSNQTFEIKFTSSCEEVLKLRSIAPATLPAAKNGAFWQKLNVAERSTTFNCAIVHFLDQPAPQGDALEWLWSLANILKCCVCGGKAYFLHGFFPFIKKIRSLFYSILDLVTSLFLYEWSVESAQSPDFAPIMTKVTQNYKYSILLPTYNEKENIAIIIWLLIENLDKMCVQFIYLALACLLKISDHLSRRPSTFL